jgi:hypothetical protein
MTFKGYTIVYRVDERYKSFDELIELLNDVEFATLKVVTKPRI